MIILTVSDLLVLNSVQNKNIHGLVQKQPFRSVLRKRYSENMQQIHRRTPMPKWNFNKVAKLFYSIKLQSYFIEIALRHGCSPINVLHIFRRPFPKDTPKGLLLLVKGHSKMNPLLNKQLYSSDGKVWLYFFHTGWHRTVIRGKKQYYGNKLAQVWNTTRHFHLSSLRRAVNSLLDKNFLGVLYKNRTS